MTTEQAILITQLPIAVGIFLGAYELYRIRKELQRIAKRKS